MEIRDYYDQNPLVRAAIQTVGEFPCTRCGGKCEVVGEFEIQRPDLFEAEPGSSLCLSLCEDCLQRGLDLELIEKEAVSRRMHRKVRTTSTMSTNAALARVWSDGHCGLYFR